SARSLRGAYKIMPEKLAIRLLALMTVIVSATTGAAAMTVSPLHVEMTSAGKSSRTQVTVTNTCSKALPVEASLQSFDIDASGMRQTKPAGDQFLVFPPQAMIPPGKTQVFRVQWVGEPLLKASESYLLSIAQIPVKLPKGE